MENSHKAVKRPREKSLSCNQPVKKTLTGKDTSPQDFLKTEKKDERIREKRRDLQQRYFSCDEQDLPPSVDSETVRQHYTIESEGAIPRGKYAGNCVSVDDSDGPSHICVAKTWISPVL